MMKSYEVGELPFKVTLEITETAGHGICAFLSGGTLPHVGGVASAVPRERSDGEGLTCDVSQLCLPGHKDVYAAAQSARTIALATGQATVVTAGIHVDNADVTQIQLLMDTAAQAIDAFLRDWHSVSD